MNRTPFVRLLDQIDQELAANGYRRVGSLFSKPLGHGWAVVHIQRSDASSGPSIKVTANVGASLEAILEFEGRHRFPRSLKDVHWDVRLGELAPDRFDRWWWIDTRELPESAREFIDAVATYGVPAAEAHADPSILLHLWQSGPIPFLPELERLKLLSILSWPAAHQAGARQAIADGLRSAAAGTGRETEASKHIDRLEHWGNDRVAGPA